jgi:predicted ester cyclase
VTIYTLDEGKVIETSAQDGDPEDDDAAGSDASSGRDVTCPPVEKNRELAKTFIDKVFNHHDIGYAKDWISDQSVDHSPRPGSSGDKASTLALFEQMFASMPDMKAEIIETVAAGNKVAIRARFSGTDKGGFMPGMPVTGKSISMESIDVIEFDEHGKSISHYGIQDTMTMLGQLGLLPPQG